MTAVRIHGRTMIKRAKLFLNGRSQAVRLPKEFRFPGTEVAIERRGETVVLTPIEGKWARFVRELPPAIDDATADAILKVAAKNRKRRLKPVRIDW